MSSPAWFHRRRAPLTVCVALLLAGCAGPGAPPSTPAPPPPSVVAPPAPPAPAPSAADWTGAVCGALVPVVDSLTTPPRPDLRDLAGTRQAYLGYLGTAAQRADQALPAVQAAGSPPVPNGDLMAAQVRDQLAGMRRNIEQARTQLERTDPNDVGSLGQGVAATGNVIASLADSARALGAISADPELGPAFDQAPACASLRPAG